MKRLGRKRFTHQDVIDKLNRLLQTLPPIDVRSLSRQFNTNHRIDVMAILHEQAATGVIKLTGTGRKGSPVIVSKA